MAIGLGKCNLISAVQSVAGAVNPTAHSAVLQKTLQLHNLSWQNTKTVIRFFYTHVTLV